MNNTLKLQIYITSIFEDALEPIPCQMAYLSNLLNEDWPIHDLVFG